MGVWGYGSMGVGNSYVHNRPHAQTPTRSHVFEHEVAVEERAVLCVELPGTFRLRNQPIRHRRRARPRDEEVPVCQSSARTPHPRQLIEHLMILGSRHVFENVAQIEPIDRVRVLPLQVRLQRRVDPRQAIEPGPDRLEVLASEGQGARGPVAARQDPLQVRIVRRIELRQGVAGAVEEAVGHRALDVLEEFRLAAEPAHHEAREKDPKDQPPPPVVPLLIVERPALIVRSALQKALHGLVRLDPREDPPAENSKVLLELSNGPDAPLNEIRVRVPEAPGFFVERRPTSVVERDAAVAGAGADQFQELTVFQAAIRRHAQRQAGQLRGAHVDGHDSFGIRREKGQRVVAGRGNREAGVARLHVEPLHQHVGVLPALRVPDAAGIGQRAVTNLGRPIAGCYVFHRDVEESFERVGESS